MSVGGETVGLAILYLYIITPPAPFDIKPRPSLYFTYFRSKYVKEMSGFPRTHKTLYYLHKK
jgi:hypothetical protein